MAHVFAGCQSEGNQSSQQQAQLMLYLLKGSGSCEIQSAETGSAVSYADLVLIDRDEKSIPLAGRIDGSLTNDLHGAATAGAVATGIVVRLSGMDAVNELKLYETSSCPLRRGVTPELVQGTDYTIVNQEAGIKDIYIQDSYNMILYVTASGGSTPAVRVQLKNASEVQRIQSAKI